MKTILSLGLAISLISSAQAGMAHSKEDLDLQIALENQFNGKLNKAYPDIRVAVSVDLKKGHTMKLDLIGEIASVPDHDKSVGEQIEAVKVFSDEALESDKISELLEIPVNEIKVVQLKKFVKASAVAASTEPTTWMQKVRESTASNYHAIVTLGIMLALSIAGILIFSIFNIGSAIQGAAKNLFQTAKSTVNDYVAPVAAPQAETSAAVSNAIAQRQWTPHQLKAVFAECYWTEQDETASALVQAFPGEAYLELSFGAEYMTYLRHVKAGSLAILEDAYFSTPHPIFFNVSVTDTPTYLYHECSQSRFDALQCSAVDMIRAQNSVKKKDGQMLQASALRTLPSAIRVRFRDVNEEEAILKSSEFSEETKVALPSLYCLQQLNNQEFEAVVNQVTVSELAEGWTGPAYLLTQISSRLPTRKREVLQQIEKTVTASRNSRGFHKIVSLCKPYHSKVDDQSREQAAA